MGINLLLLRKSIRTGWKRMTLIAGSVAIGILILFSFTAFYNAMDDLTHYAWVNGINSEQSTKPIDDVDPVYVFSGYDTIGDRNVNIYQMQAGGDKAPDILPNLPAPQPGEMYASPALAELIHQHPDWHLEQRYGKLVAELPAKVVPGRDHLYAIIGSDYPVKDGRIILSAGSDGAEPVTTPAKSVANYSFTTTPDNSYQSDVQYQLTKAVIYAGIIILLFPVIMLISIATRLGSVQREQRYAALRLIGITNRQVTGIIATESVFSTIIGIVIGVVLYLVVRPLMFNFTLAESRYWPDTITVTAIQAAVIIVLTIALSLFANWWGMRHVRTSPLGISQKQKVEKKPGRWRLLPFAASLAGLIYFSVHKPTNQGDVVVMTNQFLVLIIVTMFSLVIVTPWLTYHLSQLISRLARRPVTIISAKYIRAHARAIARSTAGVVLALYAGSFYILGTSGVAALEAQSIQQDGYSRLRDNTLVVHSTDQQFDQSLAQALQNKDSRLNMVHGYLQLSYQGDYVVGECLQLNRFVSGLDCGQGHFVAIDFYMPVDDQHSILYSQSSSQLADQVNELNKQMSDEANYDVSDRPNDSLFIMQVDNSQVESFHSNLANLTNDDFVRNNLGGMIKTAQQAKSPAINPVIENLAGLAYGGMAVTMAVAIISTVVSTIGSLLERRRSMYMLRLGGMQVSELKRMVMFESLAPLAIMSLISAGLGAISGIVFTKLGSSTLHPVVTPGYIAVVVGSLVLAALVIYLILPMIDRLTSAESNQTE